MDEQKLPFENALLIERVESELRQATRLTGYAPHLIEGLGYKPVGNGRAFACRIAGIDIAAEFIERQYSKVCPDCLADAGYRRSIWDLKTYWYCLRHKRVLTNTCPKCGLLLMWSKVWGTACTGCGGLLTDSRRDLSDGDALTWLAQTTEYVTRSGKPQADVDHFFDLIGVVAGLQHYSHDPIKEQGAIIGRMAVQEWAALATQVRKISERPEAIQGVAGESLRRMSSSFPLTGEFVWTKMWQRYFRRRMYRQRQWHPIIAALIATPLGHEDHTDGRAVGGALSLEDLGEWIGVSAPTMQGRAAKEWMQRQGIDPGDGYPRRVEVSGLDSLAARFRTKLVPNPSTKELIPLEHAIRRVIPVYGRTIFEALDAILENRLRAISWPCGEPLRKMMFEKQALEQWAREGIRPGNEMGLRDMAKKIGAIYDVLRVLSRLGKLRTSWRRGLSGRHKLTVSVKDCDSFHKQYCFASEIARRIRSRPERCADRLMNEGIRPVSGPGVDGGLVYLFKRADVEGLDLETIGDKTGYATSCGRRTKGSAAQIARAVRVRGIKSAVQTAAELGISVQRLSVLVRHRQIRPAKLRYKLGAGRYFDAKSRAQYLKRASSS